MRGHERKARRAPNSVISPKIEMTTEYEITLARTAGISASDSKSSRYSTSTASSAAPSGVRNTAEMPAATPASIRMRRSRALDGRSRPTERADRAADLHGRAPRGRPAPPLPSVKIEASALSQMTAPPDHAAVVVERVDHRVAAAAAGLGREQA